MYVGRKLDLSGYSRFEHVHRGISLDLIQFVPLSEGLKIGVLTLENRSNRIRHLSVAAYAEWTLGATRGSMAPWIVTAREPSTGALLARNPVAPNAKPDGADDPEGRQLNRRVTIIIRK